MQRQHSALNPAAGQAPQANVHIKHRNGRKKNLPDLRVTVARSSTSEISWDFPHTSVGRVYTAWCERQKTASSVGREGQRGTIRLRLWSRDDRKATGTQTITLYNRGVQKSITEERWGEVMKWSQCYYTEVDYYLLTAHRQVFYSSNS